LLPFQSLFCYKKVNGINLKIDFDMIFLKEEEKEMGLLLHSRGGSIFMVFDSPLNLQLS